jgi:hypothetical protein
MILDPEDEAFNEIERQAQQRKEAVKAAMRKDIDDDTQGYLSDRPKREWVGLTNNELQPIADEYRILFGSWVEDFARAIEAKLKEKNQ